MVGKQAGEINFYGQHKIIKKWQRCCSLTSLLPAAVLIWQMDVWMVHVCKKGASVTPSSCSLHLEAIFVRLPDFAACSPTCRSVSHLLTASCDGMLCACRVLTVDTSFPGSLLDHQLKKPTHTHSSRHRNRVSPLQPRRYRFYFEMAQEFRLRYISDTHRRDKFLWKSKLVSHPTVYCNFFTRTSRIGEKVNTLSGSC